MTTQVKDWTVHLREEQTMHHQSPAVGIPLLLSRVPDSPPIDDANKLMDSEDRRDEKRNHVTNSVPSVLALRWSDTRNKVLLMDILTGKVKAEWSPTENCKKEN